MAREWEQHYAEMEQQAEAHHNGTCVEKILEMWEVTTLSQLATVVRASAPSKPYVLVRLTNGNVRDAKDTDGIDFGDVCGLLVGAVVPEVPDPNVHGACEEVIADWIYFEDCETREIAALDFELTLDWVEDETRDKWAEYHWNKKGE